MNRTRKIVLVTLAVVLLVAVAAYAGRGWIVRKFFEPTGSNVEQGVGANQNKESIEVVATSLDIPWEIAFLPEGDMLVTERSGTLKRIGANEQAYEINGVRHVGEGGLLGLALHPDYTDNNWIYLYLTTAQGGGLVNRVERYVLSGDRLSERTVIIAGIPGASNHDGGRIAFGPDKMLYISTGDAGNAELAQDPGSLAGKILRVTDTGKIPQDNPFGDAVYSYGHRNVQGLAWDDSGQLWATEHGRSGLGSGFDELNRIERGANYGWPVIQGSETREGMRTPVLHSGADTTWAPSGLAFSDGSLFFAGLRGQSLYEAMPQGGGTASLKAHFQEEYGRLRAVVSHNDSLYISTSNTDGRGSPDPSDDRIIRVDRSVFNE